MAHTLTNLIIHAVFSTKGRERAIDAELKERLMPYIGGIVAELQGKTLAGNAMPDHVHLLLRLPAIASLSDMMRVVKTNPSRWIHETWPNRRTFGWQTGYGAFSVSQSNVPAVSRYIADQEQLHKRISFQEEYVRFLKKNGIEFDERFIWE
jgi:putative transposase